MKSGKEYAQQAMDWVESAKRTMQRQSDEIERLQADNERLRSVRTAAIQYLTYPNVPDAREGLEVAVRESTGDSA